MELRLLGLALGALLLASAGPTLAKHSTRTEPCETNNPNCSVCDCPKRLLKAPKPGSFEILLEPPATVEPSSRK